jgi:hypothetical protein
MAYSYRLDVRLTDRQESALRTYARELDVPMARYVRALLVESLPDHVWPPAPIGGQLTFPEDGCAPDPRT